jgi:uncharacterized protein (TIGR04255 family)
MIFSNPPLVELVAELRWVPGPVGSPAPAAGAGMIQFPLASEHVEQTFTNFSNYVAAQGFAISERLVPVGFPYFPFAVVYRFRKLPAQGENFLYQIGPGVFSANALPPYRDWDSFRPIVQAGVQALLGSRHASEASDFTMVSLRYIDLFSEEFTDGRQSFRFLNDILGLKVELPKTLNEQAIDIDRLQSGLQLSIPLKTGLSMNLNFQQGSAAGKNGIVMTTEVLTSLPTAPDLPTIMETLEKAHGSIRITFLGLTERIRARMRPVNGQ